MCIRRVYDDGKALKTESKNKKKLSETKKAQELEEKITGESLQIDTAASSAASTHLDPQTPPASHAQTASSSPECSWITTDESTDDDPTFSRSISPPLDIAENEDPACLIVVDKERKLEVYISDPDYQQLPGAEVLKLSTQEYFWRVHDHERRTNVTIKCLRDEVETLKKELSVKEQACKIEKKEAVTEVTKFWRDAILEGNTHGGKMVNAALKRTRHSKH